MNKSTIPWWVYVILGVLVVALAFVVKRGFEMAKNSTSPIVKEAVSTSPVRQDLKQRIEEAKHSLYLRVLQDPDQDKDGLSDIAEHYIYKTDPKKFDSASPGMGDGRYMYDVYRSAFNSGNEAILADFRSNTVAYTKQISVSNVALQFLGVASLQEMFNIRAAETYNFYVGLSDELKMTVKEALEDRQKGDYASSMRILQDALAANPNSAILKYHLGLTYHGLKQYDKAVEIYESIVNDPSLQSPLLYSDIASAYGSMGKYERFVEYMRRSITEFPEDLIQYTKLSSYYLSVHDLNKAAAVLNEGLAVEPRYADYYNGLANIAHLKGDMKTELALYQKAVLYDFRYAPGHENLAILYEELDADYKNALTEARIALELNPTAFHASVVMNLYDELGQPTESKRFEDQLLAMKDIDGAAYNSLGLKYLRLKDYAKAETYFRKAMVAEPKLPNPYNNLGIVLSETGRPEESAASYRKAIELNPNYANAYNNLGIYYTEKGDYQTALTTLKTAIKLNPNLWRPYQSIAYVYRQLGDTAQEKVNYQKAVDNGDTDPLVIQRLKELNQ
jgi:tetratricopeptide (TPR) repeat protein